MELDEALELMGMCIAEVKKRLIIQSPSFLVKVRPRSRPLASGEWFRSLRIDCFRSIRIRHSFSTPSQVVDRNGSRLVEPPARRAAAPVAEAPIVAGMAVDQTATA